MEIEFFEKVKTYLLNQEQTPGKPIETETKLAKQFGVSRYKIRQVLGMLAQMGVLERSPRRGSILKTPDKNTMNEQLKLQFDVAGFDTGEYIEARILVECAILPLVVRRITPSMFANLEASLKKIEANADNPSEADKYDRDFHLLLLKACGNRVLQVFSGVMAEYFEQTTDKLKSYDAKYFIDIAEKQRAILMCIKNGDAEKAAKLMRAHLLEKSENI